MYATEKITYPVRIVHVRSRAPCSEFFPINPKGGELRRIVKPPAKIFRPRLRVYYGIRGSFSIDRSIEHTKALPRYCIMLVMSRAFEWPPRSLLRADFKVSHNKNYGNRKTPVRTMMAVPSLQPLISSAL